MSIVAYAGRRGRPSTGPTRQLISLARRFASRPGYHARLLHVRALVISQNSLQQYHNHRSSCRVFVGVIRCVYSLIPATKRRLYMQSAPRSKAEGVECLAPPSAVGRHPFQTIPVPVFDRNTKVAERIHPCPITQKRRPQRVNRSRNSLPAGKFHCFVQMTVR